MIADRGKGREGIDKIVEGESAGEGEWWGRKLMRLRVGMGFVLNTL